jgi:hypothetical protein
MYKNVYRTFFMKLSGDSTFEGRVPFPENSGTVRTCTIQRKNFQ